MLAVQPSRIAVQRDVCFATTALMQSHRLLPSDELREARDRPSDPEEPERSDCTSGFVTWFKQMLSCRSRRMRNDTVRPGNVAVNAVRSGWLASIMAWKLMGVLP